MDVRWCNFTRIALGLSIAKWHVLLPNFVVDDIVHTTPSIAHRGNAQCAFRDRPGLVAGPDGPAPERA